MPLALSSPVTEISRIGPAKAKHLQKLGIRHARDFLYTFPRRYDDFSTVTPIAQLQVGEKMTARGRVQKVATNWGFRGRQRLLRIFVDVADDTGILAVTWFNLRFLPKQLWEGRQLYVAGKVELDSNVKAERGKELSATGTEEEASATGGVPWGPPAERPQTRQGRVEDVKRGKMARQDPSPRKTYRMRSPVIEFIDASAEQTHTASITPVYPETYGVTSRFLRYQVKNVLPLLQALPEYLPAAIRQRHNFIGIRQAITAVHFPASTKQLKEAQRRLRFDELFFLQLAALVRRRTRQHEPAIAVPIDQQTLQSFISQLPYMLTGAQQKTLGEITADLAKTSPMNRLLQGDVGSGKTVIAQAAAALTLRAGLKVLYLAPTEVLARQQHQSFIQTLGAKQASLLLGGMTQRQRARLKKRLHQAEPVCVIGTHALLQEDVIVKDLALAIVDEQHRFGVRQRQALQQTSAGKVPHLLSMTATPIPRTLNLTVFGDLDISVLDELPPGRKEVQTRIIPPAGRDDVIVHILSELHRGRQAYVVAPLVEQSEKLAVKSAKETVVEMKKLFPDIAVGLLHGQMTSAEKEQALRHFSAGALQLLVATSIVEVGVNVPNATIMIIEGAERFGLSQLHQFRGRIGRGEHRSYCYLFPTDPAGASSPRLKALTSTSSGFAIAEEDLRLRGPGEAYGAAQSGFADLKVASLLDYPAIKLARGEAEHLLQEDPELKSHPILSRKVEQKNLLAHFE